LSLRRRFAERAVGERSEMPPARLSGGLVGRGASGSARVRRSAALGCAPEGLGSADFGVFDGDAGVELFAAQPVAVTFEAEDLGMVDETVDHRGGGHVVAEDVAPR
jgi:hypothetical protein